MRVLHWIILPLLRLVGPSSGLSIPRLPGSLVDRNGTLIIPDDAPLTDSLLPDSLAKRAGDPADFGWIKKWAAVGDSFTAGIGAGVPLSPAQTELRRRGSEGTDEDWACSRYDRSYAKVLDRAFGDTEFHFVACSGDRTGDIYDQVRNLDGGLDLVVMTAGGNDLCLADMISKCVFFKNDDETCESVIDLAQKNIDTILKDNLKQVLEALNDKVKNNGIVIFNGYAQFFNTEKDDDCGGQDWSLYSLVSKARPLTLARRKKFNNLVVQINDLIKKVAGEVGKDSDIKYKIGFSNWDPWVHEGVDGQFCDPSSTGEYPEPEQKDLQFFKPETDTSESRSRRRRSLSDIHGAVAGLDEHDLLNMANSPPALTMDQVYASSLMYSRRPGAVALKKLDPRAPSPPGCPSDGSIISVPVPDNIGKNFHPNEKGHITIASFAVENIMNLRADILGVDPPPACDVVDKFTCWQKKGSKAYASADRMNANFETFCDEDMKLSYRGAKTGYIGSLTYHKGTPDEHAFSVQLAGDSARDMTTEEVREECRESMDRIINSCDGNDPDNPMNWKFGGQWQRGDHYWEVTALADRRPWPPLKEAVGDCEGWWHGVWSSYELYGGGWSGYDYGQKTLLPAAEACAGESSLWEFEYLDEATKEGYEWKANFNHLVLVRAKCYSNNKVAFKAGGFTDGCDGND